MLTISGIMAVEVSCVVPPWVSYVVPVVRHRRLGGTTLASVKMKVLRSMGACIMACFLVFSSGCGKSKWSSHVMKCCLAAMEDGMGLNSASRAFVIPKPTIRRHRLGLNKYASEDVKCMGGPLSLPAAVEDELVRHIKDLDDMMFGMTAKDLMCLAYEVAVAHGIKKFSDVKKSAGKKWYYNFVRRHPDLSLRSLRRHPDLSLRSPEATSLARAAGFNRESVYSFFDLLEKLIDENSFTPANIYNVDETGHTTVQTTSKVLSTKGKRQVGVTTSAERGSTTTGVYCHSGTGNYLPPMLVFRRKRMCNRLKTDAPAGTIFACTDSGWIDSDCFVMWLKHFIKSVNSSKENKHLLLLDGHASHTKNLEAI